MDCNDDTDALLMQARQLIARPLPSQYPSHRISPRRIPPRSPQRSSPCGRGGALPISARLSPPREQSRFVPSPSLPAQERESLWRSPSLGGETAGSTAGLSDALGQVERELELLIRRGRRRDARDEGPWSSGSAPSASPLEPSGVDTGEAPGATYVTELLSVVPGHPCGAPAACNTTQPSSGVQHAPCTPSPHIPSEGVTTMRQPPTPSKAAPAAAEGTDAGKRSPKCPPSPGGRGGAAEQEACQQSAGEDEEPSAVEPSPRGGRKELPSAETDHAPPRGGEERASSAGPNDTCPESATLARGRKPKKRPSSRRHSRRIGRLRGADVLVKLVHGTLVQDTLNAPHTTSGVPTSPGGEIEAEAHPEASRQCNKSLIERVLSALIRTPSTRHHSTGTPHTGELHAGDLRRGSARARATESQLPDTPLSHEEGSPVAVEVYSGGTPVPDIGTEDMLTEDAEAAHVPGDRAAVCRAVASTPSAVERGVVSGGGGHWGVAGNRFAGG
eukprot:Hpha_TRINITY_DN8800_c0_g1::TRINITY_DN8800_c0_g1_i1::g.141365::m.141365